MQKFSAFIFFTLIISCCSPLISTGQTVASLSIEKDQKQYGKPFSKVPDRRDVIIYQVNMRVFSKQGDFKGVKERLDSIKALGVNVIYLMPH
ncbi:MAG: hypothetical protein ABJA37_14765, partial [Ferruginibacter sp.]